MEYFIVDVAGYGSKTGTGYGKGDDLWTHTDSGEGCGFEDNCGFGSRSGCGCGHGENEWYTVECGFGHANYGDGYGDGCGYGDGFGDGNGHSCIS